MKITNYCVRFVSYLNMLGIEITKQEKISRVIPGLLIPGITSDTYTNLAFELASK
jgi:hypothetical protein